ncbi:MAG: PHP domain-containing protein [Anaerolineae bacterium]|nr:PHP domain-containing protein [Thermoflexales bacterium]MDW8053296.1 PHP domain-containing protein [Anaerolineae bacterium]
MLTELHCHTTASDGVFSPSEVVRHARARGVTLLAITDHDTLAGHAEAFEAGQHWGVRVVPGIEISTLSSQGEVHVLGYNVRPSDEAVRHRIAALRDVREHRARCILEKLAALGVHVPFEAVQAQAGDGMIGRPHVARAMVQLGLVPDVQTAFDRYLAEGKPAFVPHEGLTPADAVHLIHAANGIAVLAHPGLYQGNIEVLLNELLIAGLDGVEAYYPLHTPEQVQRFTAFAQQHGLLVTGGSDFHGSEPQGVSLLGSVQVPETMLRALATRLGFDAG